MTEYKRKFLVNQDLSIDTCKKKHIDQSFISNDRTMFIKAIDNKIFYLVKKSDGVKTKTEIPRQVYDRMLEQFANNIISKNRYYIKLNDYIIKYDIFEKELEGLKIMTIDFKTYNDYLRFQTPIWFGDEITDSSLYQQYNLANSYYDQEDNKPKKKVK